MPKQSHPSRVLNLRNLQKRRQQQPQSRPLTSKDLELAFRIIYEAQRDQTLMPPEQLPPQLAWLSEDHWAELWHLLLMLQAEQRHAPVH